MLQFYIFWIDNYGSSPAGDYPFLSALAWEAYWTGARFFFEEDACFGEEVRG